MSRNNTAESDDIYSDDDADKDNLGGTGEQTCGSMPRQRPGKGRIQKPIQTSQTSSPPTATTATPLASAHTQGAKVTKLANRGNGNDNGGENKVGEDNEGGDRNADKIFTHVFWKQMIVPICTVVLSVIISACVTRWFANPPSEEIRDPDFRNIMNGLKQLQEQIKSINDKVMNLEDSDHNQKIIMNTHDQLHRDINDTVTKLEDERLIEINTQMKAYEQLQEEINSVVENLEDERLLEIEKIKKVEALKDKLDELQKFTELVKESNYVMGEKFKTLEKETEHQLNEAQKTLDQISQARGQLEEKIEDVTRETSIFQSDLIKMKSQTSATESNAKELEELVDRIRKHVINKDALIFAVIILFVLVFLVIVAVYNMYQTLYPGDQKASANMGSKTVMARIPQAPSLDDAICLISFDQDSGRYRRLLESAMTNRTIAIRVHVITRHVDICNLPHCKLYIMCAEFSERHVIIEEQGIGLGDLKRTTHNAVKKLAGALVIVYVHDPGSRRLDQAKLYNERIYCVRSQPELSALDRLDRFISVYDTFSDVQKGQLQRTIHDVLQGQGTSN